MHAPSKPEFPIIDAKTMATFDGLIFGIPTRYGNFPGQWKVNYISVDGKIPTFNTYA